MPRPPVPAANRRRLSSPSVGEKAGAARRELLCLSLLLALLLAALGIMIAARRPVDPTSTERAVVADSVRPEPAAERIAVPPATFTDVTLAAGIHFVHQNGAKGEKLLPETMGGGSAFLDYDNDGDQDLLFVNALASPPGTFPPSHVPAPTAALYRNDGRGTFEDVTAGSGLDVPLYGMGAAVGDYDGDGCLDLFLTAVGENKLFRNLGNGKFADLSAATGVAGSAEAWSTGCGWLDYDNDGDLDLFVCNYLEWSASLDRNQQFRFADGRRAYGRPQDFSGVFPYLYRNEGNGSFTDVSKQSGVEASNPIGEPASKSLGVTFDDLDRDGWIDIIVANDTVQNQYFHNRGNGTFEEQALLAGIALSPEGAARGAMGIDSAFFQNDDTQGIAIGNFTHEMSSLFVSRGKQDQFFDIASRTALGLRTQSRSTFGTCYVDFDLDGRLDLFAVNGHLEPDIRSAQPLQTYQQSPQLFWNAGSDHRALYLEVPAASSSRDFTQPIAGRGANYADIDGDGDLDLLITAIGERPRLLRNEQRSGHHWLRFRLIGTQCNPSAIGAMVEVRLENQILRRRVMPTRSYLTQVELPLTFGLGRHSQVQSVTVHWPDGSEESIAGVAVDRAYDINQHSGIATAMASTAPWSAPVSSASQTQRELFASPLALAATLTSRSCGGNYLYSHRAGDAPLPLSRADHPDPVPCRGPYCGGIPDGSHNNAPVPAEGPDPRDHLLCMHCGLPGHPPFFSYCGPPVSQAKPRHIWGGIFRPPETC